MREVWEAKFERWAKPPGEAEQQRCDRIATAIRQAIGASRALQKRDIKVFVQGSYRNNTNVRQDSDVDVGVVCFDSFFHAFPEGKTKESFGLESATYDYAQFKNEVGEALVAYFGPAAVSRGNKAFDIKERRNQVEADVAPFFEHRRYQSNGSYISGVELRPDNGGRVINWPDQHYENGVRKNTQTGRRYKALVRILKSLRNEMDEAGHAVTKPIIGFLNECLAWNVPNDRMGGTSYYGDVRSALTFLYAATKEERLCHDWGEVSELKYLFREGQKWTREQANAFTVAAWVYVGFS